MQQSLQSRLYPIVLRKVVKEKLTPYYSEKEFRKLYKKIKKEYFGVIKRFPDIGGSHNFFTVNIYLGGYLVAVYKKTKDRVTLDEFEQFVLDSLNSVTFLKKKMEKQDFLGKEYRKTLKKVSKWCQDHEKEYPDNWQFTVLPSKKEDELCFQFNRCGLVKLCQKEGVPEVNRVLCQTDFVTYGYAGVKLERNETLAQGDERCLFVVTK